MITMATALPIGLTMGDGVTIANVSVAGYNGSFTVTGISGLTFTYTAAGGLGAGTGGTAASDTFECGMVDQGAALIEGSGTALDGQVLVAGGDILEFLGESSNTSFIFNPSGATWTRTTGSMTNARELFPLVGIPSEGNVVAYGGIQATSLACLTTPATPVIATTLNEAEVFNPSTQTWSATSNNMGVKRAATPTLIMAGTLAGQVILPGGVDVEAGTSPSTCAATTGIKQAAEAETDLYNPSTNSFTSSSSLATGNLNQAREGNGIGVIGTGTDETDVIVIGGACTTPSPSLQSVVIGSTQATTTCGTANATNDYSELYSQSSGTWTVGPSFAAGFSPTNGAASAVLP